MGKSASKLVETERTGLGVGLATGALLWALSSYALSKPSIDERQSDQLKVEAQSIPDNGPLLEYSVVYTDRALNLMSDPFKKIMREISSTLREVYNCGNEESGCAIIPGSGTYAMEAVARQFGSGKKCLILRNGYFSYRWSHIFEVTKILQQEGQEGQEIVMMAQEENKEKEAKAPAFHPAPIEDVEAKIKSERPSVVFAPHVETATGMILPDEYLKRVAKAVHEVGGIFVLDCIASGTIWVDMEVTGIDVIISAPQKGWSGPACCGIVLLSKLAMEKMEEKMEESKDPKNNTIGESFACNLYQWTDVMKKYENGGFRYYTTLPTDALRQFHSSMMETKNVGWKESKEQLQSLGDQIRNVLTTRGFLSVAAKDFQAPGVVVMYANADPNKSMVSLFKENSLQIAGGVPFKLARQPDTSTFRLGLFGLDKIADIPKCVSTFSDALDNILKDNPSIVKIED